MFWKVKSEHLVVDFLHELDVKRFEAVPSWRDEEEAGMDEGIRQVTSLNLSFKKDNLIWMQVKTP